MILIAPFLSFDLCVVKVSGNRITLDEQSGIDTLGNIMESSSLSVNRDFYGDLHNMGHVFISYAHDPDHRHLESFGVIGDSSTAMRDPIFYRLVKTEHKFRENYKRTSLSKEIISFIAI